MRSLLLLIGGLAASIFAAPVANFERRSLSSSDLADAFYARAVQTVTFGSNVDPTHHASITAAINAHHDALPANHVAKGAVKAHVMGTGWHTTTDDPNVHATVGFYQAGSRNSRNLLGGTHHVYPTRRSLSSEDLADAVFARAVQTVTFGSNVNPEHHASITAAINAHHDALPADHVAKGAVKAHVMGTGWHTTDDDPATHATVGFYQAGSRNSRNLLGGTHHVYPTRRSLSSEELGDGVFARAVQTVTFGSNVNPEHHASITAAINAHHDALPADHVAKGAVKAHVMGTGWHTTDDDPATHATVGFYQAGSRNSRNLLGGTHHVYPTS